MSCQRGQATVEVVALIPLLVVVALTIVTLLAAHSAREAAGQAAEVAAVAVFQGRDPDKAAFASLRGWPRSHVRVVVRREQVIVAVRPRGPIGFLARKLTASSNVVIGTSRPLLLR